jgi:YidC/Oxa1 family membrane protein insertase
MPVVFANVLQPLIDITEAIMVWIHDHAVGGSWGLAIIGLTIVVRLVLLPLTLKQFKSMQTLQKLSPQIKELQAKYKDDRQRLNQEMMRFYQENKVNPLGSCLPLVAQFPIFISLFYMLRKDLRMDICNQTARVCEKVDPGSAKFLFIPDLTDRATGGVLIALIVLYVGSQLASSLLMTVSADKNQRRLIVILPLVFVAFILNFPAGLLVYWITTNLWTIVQQFIVRKTVGPIRPPQVATAEGQPSGLAALFGGLGGGGGSGGTGNGKGADAAEPSEDGKAAAGAPAARPRGSPPPPSPRRKRKQRSGRRR